MNAYGKTIEFLAPPPGGVADENKLPFPKARIKSSILLMLKQATPEQRSVLCSGYLMLADFQPGVGDKDTGIDFSTIDASKMNQEELLALANRIASKPESEKRLEEIAGKERAQFEQDMRSLGLL